MEAERAPVPRAKISGIWGLWGFVSVLRNCSTSVSSQPKQTAAGAAPLHTAETHPVSVTLPRSGKGHWDHCGDGAHKGLLGKGFTLGNGFVSLSTLWRVFFSLYKQGDRRVAAGDFIFNILLSQIGGFYFTVIFPSTGCWCTCTPHPFPFHCHCCSVKGFVHLRENAGYPFHHLLTLCKPVIGEPLA